MYVVCDHALVYKNVILKYVKNVCSNEYIQKKTKVFR